MTSFIQEIIDSYEARVTAVGTLIDTTHEMIEEFRNKREEISTELKEKLANCESLRHKDFDCMMQGIQLSQKEREELVRHKLKDFVHEQKEFAYQLKVLVKERSIENENKRMEDFRTFFTEIKSRREDREKDVSEMLQRFRLEQEDLSQELNKLLAKGESIRIKDVKAMLNNFQKENSEKKIDWQELSKTMKNKRNQNKFY